VPAPVLGNSAKESTMQNIVTKIDGNKLIIEIELDASGAVPSASLHSKPIGVYGNEH
jgi:hypothetical protein